MKANRCPSCGCLGLSYSHWHAPHCEGRVIDGLDRIEDVLDAAFFGGEHERDPALNLPRPRPRT